MARESVRRRDDGGRLTLKSISGVWLAIAVLVLGCGSSGDRSEDGSLAEQTAAVFGPGASRAGKTEGEQKWVILLSAFSGPDAVRQANAMLMRIKAEGGLPDAYVQDRGDSAVVVHGAFDSPTDPRAQAELARVRHLTANGTKPYVRAFMAPPHQAESSGAAAAYDLRRAREEFGDRAKYTLQIGYYGRDELERPTEKEIAESRRAAEKAAADLRRRGETAFFYHGVMRSYVTVGTFDEDELANGSAELRQTVDRHQYHLYNGAAIKLTDPSSGASVLQRTQFVKIPGW